MRWMLVSLFIMCFLVVQASASVAQWHLVNSSVGYEAREGFATEVFDNKIWLSGGSIASKYYNDTWYTEDGDVWYPANLSAEFEARYDHHLLVLNGKMWLCGGSDDTEVYDNLWNSTDGNNWTLVNSSFFPRMYGYGAISYNGKLWVMGGVDWDTWTIFSSEVWSSTDGFEWLKETGTAAWGPRYDFEMIVFDGKMWVIGGADENDVYKYDAWYSTDGVTWASAGIVEPYNGVTAFSPYDANSKVVAVVMDQGLWQSSDMNEWTLINVTPQFETYDYITFGDPKSSVAYSRSDILIEFNGTLWLFTGRVKKIDDYPDTYNDKFTNSTWYSINSTDQSEEIPLCSDAFGILTSISAAFVMVSIGIAVFGAVIIIGIIRGGRT